MTRAPEDEPRPGGRLPPMSRSLEPTRRRRFPGPVPVVLLLSIWVAGAAWAGAETDKIKRFHSRGKLDRAWELCTTLEASGGSELRSAKDTCAQVHREQLDLANPSGLSRAQLDEHAQRWPATPAGDGSLEQAARILLAEAGQTIEKLNQVTWTYQRTDAAAEARTRIFQIAFDRAKLLGSPEAYADYRQTYPDSTFSDEAWALQEEAAFDRALSTGTAEGMQLFAAAYPESTEVPRAQKLEMDYAFHEAGKAGTSEAWHTLYKQFVAHPRRHEIQTRWYAAVVAEVDTRGVAPLLLYTAIHPSDATAREALEDAVMRTVAVSMVAGHPDHEGWVLPREGVAEVPKVSQLSKAVRVHFPHVSNHAPEIRVLAEKGADVRSLQGHLQATFRLTRTEAGAVALKWRSPEEGLWEARLPLGLCQPSGTRFIVEVLLMGETLRYPFRSDTPCADWAVPMVVWNGAARRGGTKSRGAWTPSAGELPPLPHKDVWWTGGRFEHTPLGGAGTVVTWPDGTRYWRPGTPGATGRLLDELLVLPSFPAPGFSLIPEGNVNVLRQPGGDKTPVAAGLDLQHQVWLAATRPPGQGRGSQALDSDTGWSVSEVTGDWQPLPPEGGTLLDLRFPTPEILATWTEQLKTLIGESATIRWSAMVDLDLDDQLEGFVCLDPGDGDRCYVADWREGGPAWFTVMGFDWSTTSSTAPFAFWTEHGVYLARVDDSGATVARYTGSAYLGTREGD
jgi:hypothetical protein